MDEIDWETFKKETTQPSKKKTVVRKQSHKPFIKEIKTKSVGIVDKSKHLSLFNDFVEQFTHKEEKNIKKGDIDIDAKLDLHGFFIEDAHQRVKQFIQSCFRTGVKNLLIITGKGTKGTGAIKSEFPHWLEDEDIKPMIMRYKDAHIKHGGCGAYYIFLRKKKDCC